MKRITCILLALSLAFSVFAETAAAPAATEQVKAAEGSGDSAEEAKADDGAVKEEKKAEEKKKEEKKKPEKKVKNYTKPMFKQDIWKLAAGLGCMAAGGLLMFYGYSREDKSGASLSVNSWNWNSSYSGTWIAGGTGEVENTGNVDLTNVVLTISYKGIDGTVLATDTVTLDTYTNLSLGVSDTFASTSVDCGAVRPATTDIAFQASINTIYDSRNPDIGIAGICVAALGVYFIADYFINFTGFFAQREMDVTLATNYDGLTLMASKYF